MKVFLFCLLTLLGGCKSHKLVLNKKIYVSFHKDVNEIIEKLCKDNSKLYLDFSTEVGEDCNQYFVILATPIIKEKTDTSYDYIITTNVFMRSNNNDIPVVFRYPLSGFRHYFKYPNSATFNMRESETYVIKFNHEGVICHNWRNCLP
jgi:hypothetical protein